MVDQPHQPIQQIYEEFFVYPSSEDSEVETLKEFVSIKHKLKYARGKMDPTMATSIDEFFAIITNCPYNTYCPWYESRVRSLDLKDINSIVQKTGGAGYININLVYYY